MKILLDTHAFLWLLNDDARLTPKAKRTFEASGSEMYFSLASVWEIAIKKSLGKLTIDKPLNTFLSSQLAANSIEILDLSYRHVCRVETLPFHHRDPFDRLLAAQCLEDALPIMSSDPAFDHYGIKRVW